jgi:heme-degrading monooxygenase HmoA
MVMCWPGGPDHSSPWSTKIEICMPLSLYRFSSMFKTWLNCDSSQHADGHPHQSQLVSASHERFMVMCWPCGPDHSSLWSTKIEICMPLSLYRSGSMFKTWLNCDSPQHADGHPHQSQLVSASHKQFMVTC